MKPTIILSIATLFLFACKKDNGTMYKVKYVVDGTSVNTYKISYGLVDNNVVTPFTGMRDTTVMQPAGTDVKLDSKAAGPSLTGSIYVNDVLVATQTDPDSLSTNKTEVKLDYVLPK
jgi:hypothetical protein